MAIARLPFAPVTSSRGLQSGAHVNNVNSLLAATGNVPVALAGGGRSSLTPAINNAFTEILVTATAADSVVMPPAKAGLRIGILNSGVASAQVFADGTDSFKTGAAVIAGSVGVALATLAAAYFICFKDGVWVRLVSA